MDTTWKCRGIGAGNWSDPRNWTDAVPGPGDTAVFDDTSQQASHVDADFPGTIARLELRDGFSGTITLNRDLTLTDTLTWCRGAINGTGTLRMVAAERK